eukprot:CAMPEP_0115517052 /NCGR_PEP_ID=MMETSP0271-20121206/77108_1 /TAXON_ID=71861 /ORGANISM="Scrippsiella trochoidea, Strain CCMP3099" /LENGTH=88 /DNA_ID=CAMNT_0002947793 /DNA_START=10 /DNA_END=277 /DNA_ORIENTATION=-
MAPEAVVVMLLQMYPEAASYHISDGNLPLHLALETGAPEAVVRMLLQAYQEAASVEQKSIAPRAGLGGAGGGGPNAAASIPGGGYFCK